MAEDHRLRISIEGLRGRFELLRTQHQKTFEYSDESMLDTLISELFKQSNEIFETIDSDSQLDKKQLIVFHDELVAIYVQFKTDIQNLDLDSSEEWRILNYYGLNGEEPETYESDEQEEEETQQVGAQEEDAEEGIQANDIQNSGSLQQSQSMPDLDDLGDEEGDQSTTTDRRVLPDEMPSVGDDHERPGDDAYDTNRQDSYNSSDDEEEEDADEQDEEEDGEQDEESQLADEQEQAIDFKSREAVICGRRFVRNSIASNRFTVHCPNNAPNKRSTGYQCDSFATILAETRRTPPPKRTYEVLKARNALVGFKGHSARCQLKPEEREAHNQQLVTAFKAHMQALGWHDEVERYEAFMAAAPNMSRVPFHQIDLNRIATCQQSLEADSSFLQFVSK